MNHVVHTVLLSAHHIIKPIVCIHLLMLYCTIVHFNFVLFMTIIVQVVRFRIWKFDLVLITFHMKFFLNSVVYISIREKMFTTNLSYKCTSRYKIFVFFLIYFFKLIKACYPHAIHYRIRARRFRFSYLRNR